MQLLAGKSKPIVYNSNTLLIITQKYLKLF